MSLSNRVGKEKSSGGEEEDQRSSRRRLAETGFEKGGEGKGEEEGFDACLCLKQC